MAERVFCKQCGSFQKTGHDCSEVTKELEKPPVQKVDLRIHIKDAPMYEREWWEGQYGKIVTNPNRNEQIIFEEDGELYVIFGGHDMMKVSDLQKIIDKGDDLRRALEAIKNK